MHLINYTVTARHQYKFCTNALYTIDPGKKKWLISFILRANVIFPRPATRNNTPIHEYYRCIHIPLRSIIDAYTSGLCRFDVGDPVERSINVTKNY